MTCEVEEVTRCIYHAVILVEDDHSSGPHHRSRLSERVEIDRYVEHALGETAARGASNLHCLEFPVVGDAPSNIKDNFSQCRSHRHLHQTGIEHLTCQGEDSCSLRGWCADACEPIRATVYYVWHAYQRLYIVYQRWLIPQACGGRERRAVTGPASPPLKRCDECCFLAANECPGAPHHLNIEAETAFHNIIAEETQFPCLVQGGLDTFHRQRVLGTNIYIAFGSSDSIASHNHALDDRMRVALYESTVHKCAGVTLIGVADNIPGGACSVAAQLPFLPGRKTGAAPTSELGALDLCNNILRLHL